MATLSENINQVINDFDSIKSAIVDKGVDVPINTPTKEYSNKIAQIPSGGEEQWKPHIDWWDIETMVKTSKLQWNDQQVTNVRYGFVAPDSNNHIRLQSGYQYYLSDGSYYNVTSGYTDHVWDRTKDKNCSDGYKTRAVVVCGISRDVTISHRSFNQNQIDSLYIYLDDCNIVNMNFCGVAQIINANKLLQAIKHTDKTTINPTGSIPNYAFNNCLSLQYVELPEGVTSIGNSAFQYCHSLKAVRLPSTVTRIISSMFYQCYSLREIEIPRDTVDIGNNAFYNCNSLKSIKLPKGLTSIGNSCFQYCYSLMNIELSESLTSIGTSCFQNCASLESLIIPEGVSVLSNYLFQACSNLTFVKFPSSLTSIGINLFSTADSIKTIMLPENFNFSLGVGSNTNPNLSVSGMENMINKYADRSGQDPLILTLGTDNLNKLSDEIKAEATDKNITLA